jgi:hypothetical protein
MYSHVLNLFKTTIINGRESLPLFFSFLFKSEERENGNYNKRKNKCDKVFIKAVRAFLAASFSFSIISPMYREQKHFLLPNKKNPHFPLLFHISIKH